MRGMGRFPAIVAVAIGLVLGTASQLAAEPAPCDADMRTFCRGVGQGHGAMQRCMQDNFAALSSACRAHLQGTIERLGRTAEPRTRNGKAKAKKPDE